jgi:hypothetical protein
MKAVENIVVPADVAQVGGDEFVGNRPAGSGLQIALPRLHVIRHSVRQRLFTQSLRRQPEWLAG